MFEPTPRRIRVECNRKTIAESERAMLLLETGHLPVYYFPVEDVRKDVLVPSDQTTWCPFKGRARYWHVRSGELTVLSRAHRGEDP